MNPAQKALWYIESHLARPADARRDLRRRRHLALPYGAGLCRCDRLFGDALRARPPSHRGGARARGRRARHPRTSRWMRITALTKHSPARSATISASRPKWSAPRRASTQLKLQEPILMDSTAFDNIAPPRFETGKAMLVAGVGERFSYRQRRRHSRAVASLPSIRPRAFRAGSGRWPMASAAMAMMPAISTTSPASRSPTSPICRASSAACASPSSATRCSPTPTTSRRIRRTVNTIWNHWLPASGHKLADAPNFERYDEKFDPATGNGGLEIWVPIKG